MTPLSPSSPGISSRWTEQDMDRPKETAQKVALLVMHPSLAIGAQYAAEEERAKDYRKLLLGLFPLLMLFGNLLVLVAVVREKSLRTLTNYFLCSLAVADIMVGVAVVPFAIYEEIVGKWDLGRDACNLYVFNDVLASTASILNLAAISVDRYIAVTQPVKYAKHGFNIRRVCVTIVVVWVISAGTASPIILGVNVPPETPSSEDDGNNSSNSFDNSTTITTSPSGADDICTLFNADFMIYSSIISFYIPCVITVCLYCRVCLVVEGRASARAEWRTSFATLSTDATGGEGSHIQLMAQRSSQKNAGSTPDLQGLDSSLRKPTSDPGPAVDTQSQPQLQPTEGAPPKPVNSSSATSPNQMPAAPDDERSANVRKRPEFGSVKSSSFRDMRRRSSIKALSAGNTWRRTSTYPKETNATFTIAVVLGFFLICWVPFFILNVTLALCMKFDLKGDACHPSLITIKVFVWLGYINSLINPIVYTIFNVKFRSAFFKILFGSRPLRRFRRVGPRKTKITTAAE